jgi:hypothetical protein
LQAPQDVHDVSDHILHDYFDPCTPKHKVDYIGGNHGNMYKALRRNNAVNGVDGEQHTNTGMPTFDKDQRRCFVAAQNLGDIWTYTLPTKDIHHSTIQPAPDPVMLDLKLSPLGGETTSTPFSKYSFDFFSDAVDWDPSVKRFSDPVDWNECRQVDQGQVVLAASNRRNTLLVNMTILLEAPNHLHNHNVLLLTK